MNNRIVRLERDIEALENQLVTEKLLLEVWLELTPYDTRLSANLMRRLRNHFHFDDSE
jgi:hypothetical protein